jgi:hypothetical protein
MEQEKERANRNRAFWLEMDWIFKPETRNG